MSLAILFMMCSPVLAAEQSQDFELPIADSGSAKLVIVASPDAGKWETKAAGDLQKYIRLMTGATLPIVHSADKLKPAIVLGKAALSDETTAQALRSVAKPHPMVQSDAISILREGNRLYVAGSNDESDYFAVSWLLQHWGCRWYMPTEFGEFVPRRQRLSVGALSFRYAPPFEIRRYWLSWNGPATGSDEFRHRNFMSDATVPGSGQALNKYTSDIAPPGGTSFDVPFADPKTAEHVATKIAPDYAAGKDISLAIADGTYRSSSPADQALISEYDPYFLRPSLTDAMLTLLNNVSRILRAKYPDSRSKIGALAYANVTLPPRKVTRIEPNIYMWIAPIDIDPNHSMDDPRSVPKREYREMVRRWSVLLHGRLAIYDYDQGMLLWRDLPDPSQFVFARDVKIYRDLGILGIQTESRGALATTFLNLFFRGQLMWNPDANVQDLLNEFYIDFYGPAAEPMRRYWSRIFNAWQQTNVTEHEYFVIPAIYTPELVAALRTDLEEAEKDVASVPAVDSAVLKERMAFTRTSFDLIASTVAMVTAAASDADYTKASAEGDRALAFDAALKALNPLFTAGIVGGEDGPGTLPAEVNQYRSYRDLTTGAKGHLAARLPLEWRFKIEEPLPVGWEYHGSEGANTRANLALLREDPTAANGWNPVRSDLYLQAQDVLGPNGQSGLGHYWYRTTVALDTGQTAGPVHLMFPGLFNEAWLYVNGKLVAHRSYEEPWWKTDYLFDWDVDLAGRLHTGSNEIALRGFNPHHYAGMFRRPFLYVSKENQGR